MPASPKRIPILPKVKETHMHALKISIDNKDSITYIWTLYEKGDKKSDVIIKLTRTKS